MKKGRRKAREYVLQVLYQRTYESNLSETDSFSNFQSSFHIDQATQDFVKELVTGVVQYQKEIDSLIEQYADNWRLDRMAIIDKNILRLGIFELSYRDDIPATVTINEMVELAKEYGAEGSPSFVNGILDKVRGSVDLSRKVP